MSGSTVNISPTSLLLWNNDNRIHFGSYQYTSIFILHFHIKSSCGIFFQGSAEFLGRTTAYPMVKLDPGDMRMPVLQWYPIKKGPKEGGEMLAAFELFLVGAPLPFYQFMQLHAIFLHVNDIAANTEYSFQVCAYHDIYSNL